MYSIVKVLIVVCCLGGVLYLFKMNMKYKNDNSRSKDEIIEYFKK